MGRNVRQVASVALGFLALFLVAAGQLQAKPFVLTKDSVQRFLMSVPEMQMIGLREGLNVSTSAQKAESPFTAVIEAVTRKELRDEVRGVLSRHGFDSIKDWAKTGRSIGHAYVHLTTGSAGKTASNEMAKNRGKIEKQIDDLGFLSDKQKRKLMEKFDDAGEDLGREPPAQNVSVVKDMKPQIEAMMNVGSN